MDPESILRERRDLCSEVEDLNKYLKVLKQKSISLITLELPERNYIRITNKEFLKGFLSFLKSYIEKKEKEISLIEERISKWE